MLKAKTRLLAIAIGVGVGGIIGCEEQTPPAEDVAPVPLVVAPQQPADEAAIAQQRVSQRRDFLDAYERAREPHIIVYVHRSMNGRMLGAESTESIDSEQGGFNQADLNTLDRLTLEETLSDWLSCGGQAHVLTAEYLSARLGVADMAALDDGNQQVLQDLATKLGADVLIEVQAQPVRQQNGVYMHTSAQTITVKGDRLGSTAVDISVPLDQPQINQYTRTMADQLMQEMTQSWAPGGAKPQRLLAQLSVPPVQREIVSPAPPPMPLPPPLPIPTPTPQVAPLSPPLSASVPLTTLPSATGSPAAVPPATAPSQQMDFGP